MFVFSNLATSLDGKIALADRGHVPIGTPEDRKQMQVLRAESDIVVFGATTLRAFQRSCGLKDKSRVLTNGVISRTLEGFSPDWEFFKATHIKRILFVSAQTPESRLRLFRESSEIVVLEESGIRSSARQILEACEQRGLARVLIEGGGAVMWDFVAEDLIDRVHVTLTPKILGGVDAPTLVEGAGFTKEQIVNLKLVECRPLGDEIYLTYAKTGRRGV